MLATKHNPRFLTDDELVRSYCIRKMELASILETIHESTEPSNQHIIVFGPSGSGKSTLVLRVAAEVRRHPCLAPKWFPIVFAEESYAVSTCGEFWLECLSQLAAQAPDADTASGIRLRLADIKNDHDDRMVRDRCLSVLHRFSLRQEKRLLLVVENLNLILEQMRDSVSPWGLRHTLQTDPWIFLLATAPGPFEQIATPEHALYYQFRVIDLPLMTVQECSALWESIAQHRLPEGSIHALQIVMGSSPRLLSALARCATDLSVEALTRDIRDLIDDQTEYFKGFINSLPPHERRVFVALAEAWEPATAREVAEISCLPPDQCWDVLHRLLQEPAVGIPDYAAKEPRFHLQDRLFSLYYALRQSGKGDDSAYRSLLTSLFREHSERPSSKP